MKWQWLVEPDYVNQSGKYCQCSAQFRQSSSVSMIRNESSTMVLEVSALVPGLMKFAKKKMKESLSWRCSATPLH